MRTLLTSFSLAVLAFLTSCERFTTSEFVEATVDFNTVEWYAKRAQLAYNTEEEIRSALDNVLHVENLPEQNILYFVEQLPDNRQLISVRGTDNLANVREDLEYKKSRNSKIDIFVHNGFDEDTQAVYESVLPHLDKNQDILVTGHSLGAAVSTLLMIYLHHDDFKVGDSVNFGQPKFTNKQGAKTYDFLPLTRVVNNDDVVPLLPPVTIVSSVHGKYHHVGEEVILLNGPHFVYLDNHIVLEKDLADFWANLGETSVEDHRLVNYRANIQGKFTQQVEVPFDQRHDFHEKNVPAAEVAQEDTTL